MSSSDSSAASTETKPDEPSRLGKFIQTYHSFLSSFVIGAAGLIATSIWQYRQSEIAGRQAESQQRIAATQAENSWRIERAEILAKNLQTLSSSGEGSVEQRYGVLLSLTRGNILDPELAVSYALELGKDNPDYMKSVLASTADKSYPRLASAFELTCTQRFGLNRDVPLCKDDKRLERSEALSELIADETETARRRGKPGPLVLLADEREVQAGLTRLAWLFAPYLSGLYERRQWSEISHFEATSVGARLVAAMVLGPARPAEFVASGEAAEITAFHDERVRWLSAYLFGPSCNGECRGKLVDYMLTFYAESQGRFDGALDQLLARPHAEVASALTRLHSRLLLCQVEDGDLSALRDRVLVPSLARELAEPKPRAERVEDLVSLLALVPEPAADPEDAAAQASHKSWQEALGKVRAAEGERFGRVFSARRAAAEAMRSKPPVAVKKALFCTASEITPPEVNLDDE
jgi:hypothetical protein